MTDGLWVLAGVGLASLLNLFSWFVQFRIQVKKNELDAERKKLEELSQLLTKAEELFKRALVESMSAVDLQNLWHDRDLWAGLPLIQAETIVRVYFSGASKLFDEMQTPVLRFANEVKSLMGRGSPPDRTHLPAFHDEFVMARWHLLQKCHELLSGK